MHLEVLVALGHGKYLCRNKSLVLTLASRLVFRTHEAAPPREVCTRSLTGDADVERSAIALVAFHAMPSTPVFSMLFVLCRASAERRAPQLRRSRGASSPAVLFRRKCRRQLHAVVVVGTGACVTGAWRKLLTLVGPGRALYIQKLSLMFSCI